MKLIEKQCLLHLLEVDLTVPYKLDTVFDSYLELLMHPKDHWHLPQSCDIFVVV
jgi:hypothetical protein